MSYGDWLLDDQGRFWRTGSQQLRQDLWISPSHPNYNEMVIRNLGFVRVRALPSGTVITLRPEVVSDAALAAACYWLGDFKPSRVVVERTGRHPQTNILTTANAAIVHISNLTVRSRLSRRLTERPLCIRRDQAPAELAMLIEKWSTSEDVIVDQLVEISNAQLKSRHLITKLDQSTGDVLFDAIGAGLEVPDNAFFSSGPDSPLNQQADTEYWAWAEENHRNALVNGQAGISRITAEIFWPETGWVKRDYIRLLLPCVTFGGERRLFSANCTVKAA